MVASMRQSPEKGPRVCLFCAPRATCGALDPLLPPVRTCRTRQPERENGAWRTHCTTPVDKIPCISGFNPPISTGLVAYEKELKHELDVFQTDRLRWK